MFMRVVRFTGIDAGTIDQQIADFQESEGPPPGIKATGLQMILDRDQGTAVVIQFFDSEQDMRDSEAAFDSMDASDTPGTRASVDRGELKLDLKM